MTSDTELRDLLTAEASGAAGGSGGWDDVVRRGRHRQRVRRARTTALGGLAVALAITGFVLADQDEDLETVPPATTPTAPPTTEPDPVTSTSVQPQGTPLALDSSARVQGAFLTVLLPPAGSEPVFDQCTRFHARVVESPDQVGIALVEPEVEPGFEWVTCQAGPFSAWGTVELADPLVDRRVVDLATGDVLPVIDGTDLLFPTVLPEPFDMERWDEFSYAETTWTFTFGGNAKYLNVTTGYGGTDECDRERVEVRGVEGRLCRGAYGHYDLHWEEGGRTIAVELGATDPETQSGLTLEDVLAIAEGLEPLGASPPG